MGFVPQPILRAGRESEIEGWMAAGGFRRSRFARARWHLERGRAASGPETGSSGELDSALRA
jgi:hypothetical protein